MKAKRSFETSIDKGSNIFSKPSTDNLRTKRSSETSLNKRSDLFSESSTDNLRTIKENSIDRSKRSIEYEGVVYPRIPTDPEGDISYYVKNKKGTNYNFDLEQAALLRLSLEGIFQRGNINVVHKYGSNYNPAIPNPFYFGVARTIADV